MTTHELNNHTVLIVDRDQEYFKHEVVKDTDGNYRVETSDRVGYTVYSVYSEPLPPGNWQLIQSEEDAKGVVEVIEGDEGYYPNYDGTTFREVYALESLNSWIKSIGKEPKKVVILKKM